ncbi:MAG: 50S ribosomal protein L25/general stress protein Ctc [Albidovulum sp.]|nr:50S ribosomal protein L25/general stress protein Ctc [Albidovulum sp.]
MADEAPILNAVVRARTGKGAARQARRDGFVPGIVYGGEEAPLPINIKFSELVRLLKKGRFLSTLFNLKFEGEGETRVICRGVQRDVVLDLPTHVDLMRLRTNSQVNLFIPVKFSNEELAPGIKRGGVLTVVRNEIELKVTAGEIPDAIEVDLTGLDVGDVVTISKVSLPAGTKPSITGRDFVIANISAPSGLRSADQEEEQEEESAVEIPEQPPES